MKIIWFAFIVHLIFLVSVFDIYFTTPVIHGIPEQQNSFPAPAKRLVLFVGDGMRADVFFRLSVNKTEAPFLRDVIERRGTWGVSHTRVPTESRPGHVALIAGLYEDPSAIAKGWKENPVEFDSVFNRSIYSWAWGSPDILPMFSKASGDRMWIETFSSDDQDFSGGQKGGPSWLDEWVFSRFENFIEYIKRKENTSEQEVEGGHRWRHVREEGVVFFLHLLASDTAGHIFKPHSWEYQKNVHLVDSGIKKVVNLVENLYDNDRRTVYVFTSDHGMTDWGSHGAGDTSETQTPLVVWGAGVPGPISSDSNKCKKNQKLPPVDDEGWNLSHLCRHDVWQADIAPLMSTLVGAAIPVNSVGYLRRAYLDLNPNEMAEAAFTNARQMLAQHTHRRIMLGQRQGDRGWNASPLSFLPSFYSPFPSFPPEEEDLRVITIRNLIDSGQYEKAMAQCDELFDLASAGVEYHHRYHRPLLLFSISLAFLGWISILVMSVIYPESCNFGPRVLGRSFKPIRDLPFVFVGAFVGLYLYALYAPLQYYVYCMLPVGLWWLVALMLDNHRKRKLTKLRRPPIGNMMGILSSALLVTAYAIGVEILVISFIHRWVLSLGMLGLAFSSLLKCQPANHAYYRRNMSKVVFWATSCFMLGVFPLTPVVGKQVNTVLVTIAGWMFVIVGFLGATLLARIPSKPGDLVQFLKRFPYSLWVQLLVLIPLAIWNVSEADKSFDEKKGLPLICQSLSWILSVSSIGLLLLTSCHQPQSNFCVVMQHLMSVSLSIAVPFLMLSVNHEGLFLLALALNVHSWVLLELADHSESTDIKETVSRDDFRRAYFFVFLIITSFFGTGNVASINSFDPAWVRRFLSIFSPHAMGALILAKTCFPFLLVSCAFRAINLLLNVPTKKLFLVVLALSDATGLHFLHLVKDKGSWLEIGSSLSHFVILETMVLFLLLLYGLSCVLIPSSVLLCSKPSMLMNTSVKVTMDSPEEGKNRRNDKTHHD